MYTPTADEDYVSSWKTTKWTLWCDWLLNYSIGVMKAKSLCCMFSWLIVTPVLVHSWFSSGHVLFHNIWKSIKDDSYVFAWHVKYDLTQNLLLIPCYFRNAPVTHFSVDIPQTIIIFDFSSTRKTLRVQIKLCPLPPVTFLDLMTACSNAAMLHTSRSILTAHMMTIFLSSQGAMNQC